MCGIVGYVGRSRSVNEVLIDGLRRLEYRGYDSAGVAVWNGRELVVRRAVGKLSNLEAQLRGEELSGERVVTTASAYEPTRRFATARVAVSRSAPASSSRSIRWATSSVSVSDSRVQPAATSSARISR